jgi:hypothetical protein
VSVAHNGEMNGDLMSDPEIVFELAGGGWHPVSIQRDYTGSYGRLLGMGVEGALLLRSRRAGLSADRAPPGRKSRADGR